MRVISENQWQKFQQAASTLPIKDRDKALE
jgi:hypothetical protein